MWWQRIKTPHDILKQPLQAFFRMVGARLIGVFRRIWPAAKCPTQIQDILVIRRNRLGDAVITAQNLRALLDRTPSLRMTVVANAYSREIYRFLLPEADVIVLPDKYLGTALGNFWHPEVLKQRGRQFDVALIASGSFSSRSILLLLMFRSRFRVGVRDDARPSLFEAALDASLPMSVLSGDLHQALKVSRIFALAGLDAQPVPKDSWPKPSSIERVLLFIDCNRPESRISESLWAAFAGALNSRGVAVKVCTQKQSAIFPSFVERVLCHDTAAMIQAIENCDHVVCSEGGASHVGAMLRRRLTVFSGVRILRTWFPVALDCVILEKEELPVRLTLEDMMMSFDRAHPDALSGRARFPDGQIQQAMPRLL